MSDSMTKRVASVPVHSLDIVGPGSATPAKASLKSPSPSIVTVVKDALLEHGKLESSARSMHTDASQLSRDLRTGKLHLGKLDDLEPSARALVADRVHEAFGTPTDPKELIRREIREARSRLNRIEELIAREG